MLTKSESCESLFGALAKAQSEIGVAVFDSVNPHFRSKYASLSAVREVIKGPFAKHGLSVSQWLDGEGQEILLTTLLTHSSGQYIQSTFPLLLQKRDMQGLGSATTYARRYALAAIAGVVSDEDDDGNEASIPRPTKSMTESAPAPMATRVSSAPRETHQAQPQVTQDLSDPANYVIQIGKKYKGKRLGEIPSHELKNYYEYFVAQRDQGKKIADNVLDLLIAIENYLKPGESEVPPFEETNELPF